MRWRKSNHSIYKTEYHILQKVFWGREGIWSRGYCVSTIGLNEKEILAYVEHQSKEDRGQLKFNF